MYKRVSTWRGCAAGVVLGALALCGVAAADTICVPDDYGTIQEAIDAATDGDEICVAPGTYYETIDFLGKAVRLYSTDGPQVTTIDADDLGTVVRCGSGEGPDTVLEGFTITNGLDGVGGGMRNSNSSPTITNCRFVGNRSEFDGGGMYNADSNPTITDCTFSGNRSNQSSGGGMENVRSSPTVTNCSFTGNRAHDSFGGGMANDQDSSPTIMDCTFTSNSAAYSGGGMSNAGNPTLTNCWFSSNSGSTGGGMANGGSPTLINCTFIGNQYSTGGGMHTGAGDPTLIHCNFIGNTASAGGGMYVAGGSPTVTSCSFSENGNGKGAGMYITGGSPTVTNCTFIGNDASNQEGGGMYTADGTPTFTNCTFSENNATTGGGMFRDGGSPKARNCIFWDNTPNSITGTLGVTYSDVEGGYDGAGNIDTDPLLDGAWRPQAGSPVIDAGNNDSVPEGITEDLDGNPRFVDDPDTEDTGNGPPPVVDMGAYEFQVACPADIDGDGAVDFDDLVLVLAAWGNEGGPEDLDGSGTVDFGDLLIVLDSWGCGPIGACCFFDGCTEVYEATCISQGGLYQGEGTICEDGCPTIGALADDCADAPLVGDGSYWFFTHNASDDGPSLPPECDEGDGRTFRWDVWIRYAATCTGIATASVCDSNFNTKLAVYNVGACPGDILACSDDACGEDGTRSEAVFPVVEGEEYLVRVGSGTSTGSGTLVLSCSEGFH